MKEQTVRSILQKSLDNALFNVNNEKMMRTFEKSAKEEKLMQAMSFSDLFGGMILILIILLLYLKDPSTFSIIPAAGKIGALVFGLTFVVHHVLALRIKLMKSPEAPSLLLFLSFQLNKINSRVALLRSYKWLLLIGLSGVFLLFVTISPKLLTGLISFLLLGSFGVTIHFLTQKKLKTKILPLQKETIELLRELESSD